MSATKYDQVKSSRREIFVNNIIGGIAWGVGATIGLSLILTLIAFVVQQLHYIPFIGNSAAEFYSSIMSVPKNK